MACDEAGLIRAQHGRVLDNRYRAGACRDSRFPPLGNDFGWKGANRRVF